MDYKISPELAASLRKMVAEALDPATRGTTPTFITQKPSFRLETAHSPMYEMLKRQHSHMVPLRAKVIEALNLDAFSPAGLINRVLQKNPGVFLCDIHGYYNIPEFIARSMPELKASGVTKIFMEMFPADTQPMLDRYFSQGDNSEEVMTYLTEHWSHLEKELPQKYFDIVRYAKENGIKVYGLDEPVKTFKNNPISERELRSNPFWKDTVINNTNPHDKYIVYGGAGHAITRTEKKGVDCMLGIPSIIIKTDNKEMSFLSLDKFDFVHHLPESPNQPKSLY